MERYNQFIEVCRRSLGVVHGDLVDVAACACACAVDLVDVAGWGKTLRGGGVVCLSLDSGKVWRIIPCDVYKIYTLGRFQFHSLLRRSLVVVLLRHVA